LGSSLGDRVASLVLGLRILDAVSDVAVTRCSPVYASRPSGVATRTFLNMAARISTSRSPQALLALCKQIEARLGRQQSCRWGDRVIDLDILVFGAHHLDTSELCIPHPQLLQRGFALLPAIDVGADLIHPVDGRKLGQIEIPAPSQMWRLPIIPQRRCQGLARVRYPQ